MAKKRRPLIVALVLMASCGESTETSTAPAASPAVSEVLDWSDVVDDDIEDPSYESFEEFLLHVQLERAHVRDQGQAYFGAHGITEEFAYWLPVTLLQRPYPISEEELRADAYRLGPREPSYYTKSAQNAYKPALPSYREDDLATQRLIDLAELRWKLLRHRSKNSYGFEVDTETRESLFSDLIAFLKEYDTPVDASDQDVYVGHVRVLLSIAFNWTHGLDLTTARRNSLAILLRESPIERISRIALSLQDNGSIPPFDDQSLAASRIDAYFAENEIRAWSEFEPKAGSGVILDAIYLTTEAFPSRWRYDDSIADRAQFAAAREIGAHRFRALGLHYWEYMTREERFGWLLRTTELPPLFATDFSNYLLREDKRYQYNTDPTEINWNYLNSSDAKVFAKIDELAGQTGVGNSGPASAQLVSFELRLKLFRAAMRWSAFRDNQALKDWFERVRELDSDPNVAYAGTFFLSTRVMKNKELLGLNDLDLDRFFASMTREEMSPPMRDLFDARVQSQPLVPGVEIQLAAPTLDGLRTVRLSDFRGKAVLIDNWDTDCAPCIQAFPKLEEIYQDYKDRGFEIMSIAYDGGSKRSQINRIKARAGTSWETLNGEGLWPIVSTRYQIRGFPQYMLVDRAGVLVAGNKELGGVENLRTYLDQIFEE